MPLVFPTSRNWLQSVTVKMLVATFSIPPKAFALKQTLADLSHIDIEAERIAAHSTKWTMPCLWIASDDFDQVDAALRNDPSVDSIIDTHKFDADKYYHLEWSDAVENRIDTYIDKEGSILNAQAKNGSWRVQFRFASRDQFDKFRKTLTEEGYTFDLLDLYEPGAPHTARSGVTPAQRNALVTARQRGYYMVPREISARDLAAELDMSHQALSELLRRGMDKLIDHSLETSREGE